MAKLDILTYPNKILKKKSVWIEKIDDDLVELAINMIETMYRAPGIGLAAPQVGISKRMIVMDLESYDTEAQEDFTSPQTVQQVIDHKTCNVFINPEILEASKDLEICEEGCLSVPGYTEKVERASKVKATAMLLNGDQVEFEAEGLFAVCLQHEIDHLDGKLFIDRISSLKRNLFKKKAKQNKSSDSRRSM